jgi:hypothetical protein
MPGQDMNNNLKGDIIGLDEFLAACKERGVTEVNITGTNTDPNTDPLTRAFIT